MEEGEKKLHCNILLSKFFSNSVPESDSNYPDAALVQERVCHLISGDSEQSKASDDTALWQVFAHSSNVSAQYLGLRGELLQHGVAYLFRSEGGRRPVLSFCSFLCVLK